MRGDLSSITAPPFILAPQSLVEFPAYWAERPRLFTAPALEADPARRLLCVLKLYLASLQRQYYVGRTVKEGLKKPLNPFLGELFLGEWKDESGSGARTRVVSEQVSHHPPTTACYVEEERFGVRVSSLFFYPFLFNMDNLMPMTPKEKRSWIVQATNNWQHTGSSILDAIHHPLRRLGADQTDWPGHSDGGQVWRDVPDPPTGRTGPGHSIWGAISGTAGHVPDRVVVGLHGRNAISRLLRNGQSSLLVQSEKHIHRHRLPLRR